MAGTPLFSGSLPGEISCLLRSGPARRRRQPPLRLNICLGPSFSSRTIGGVVMSPRMVLCCRSPVS
eukprot:4691939-Alexandrium_andersonii.AAC.1